MKNRGEGGRSLHRFEAGLACLLGVRVADQPHAAPHGAKWVLVQDQFNRLPTPQPEIPVQPETALRGIHDQTGNSRLVSFEVDDQAGALLRRNPPQVSWLARISCQRRGRRLACRTFLRRRMDLGVISTNSSSAMNSMACSRLNSL